MASIHCESKYGKKYYKLCVSINGKRARFGLGYDHQPQALTKLELIATKLESLKMSDERLDPKLSAEVNRLDQSIVDWFVSVGLVEAPMPRLKEFMDAYIDAKHGIEEYTIYKMRKSARFLLEFFKNNPRVSELSKADVEDYINYRRKKGKAEDTIRSEVKHGRQFFDYAKKKMFVSDNPFEEHKFSKTDLEVRKVVIAAEILEKTIDAAPCNDWKCLISVLRWTGCRLSESFKLKWEDIDWDNRRMRITSDKTKKAGRGFRDVPLFGQLEKVLKEVRAVTGKDTVYVVNGSLRATSKDEQGRMSKNLRKPFEKIVAAAGYKLWVKPFQNLRVTRENELIRQGYPSHVVHAWLGHTQDVAKANYLTVTDADFEKALGSGGQIVGCTPTHQTAKEPDQEPAVGSTQVLQGAATGCCSGEMYSMPPQGLEKYR